MCETLIRRHVGWHLWTSSLQLRLGKLREYVARELTSFPLIVHADAFMSAEHIANAKKSETEQTHIRVLPERIPLE